MHIIDRRLNPRGKSLANRQRFLRRAKALVRRAVRESAGQRGIKDLEQGGEISIPLDGISEPVFRRSSEGGLRDHVLPGNKEYVEGDTLPRPPQGGGGGSEGSPDGGGEDDFRFVLSREEFMDLFLEDLELPDLVKRRLTASDSWSMERAGFTVSGAPANLALTRTMRNSLSRRIALKRAKPSDLRRLREEIEDLERSGKDPARLAELQDELAVQLKRTRNIPYIDPLDVRYKRFEPVPKPIAQAVMFCLMDVSGSMTEHMKDLAKRFFMLLYTFLKRRYRHVDVVFIRHAHYAQEVDEDTFFHSRETGGTVVSTALEEMVRIVRDRYPPSDWNIYGAQASDGDNVSTDNAKTLALLSESILPVCQYYAYIEVARAGASGPIGFTGRDSDLWQNYELLVKPGVPLAMRRVRDRREIYPVFRDLFQKDAPATPREPA